MEEKMSSIEKKQTSHFDDTAGGDESAEKSFDRAETIKKGKKPPPKNEKKPAPGSSKAAPKPKVQKQSTLTS